jgi:type II restriction enzyme
MRKLNPKKVHDAGYDAMVAAIRSDRAPNLFVLQYSSSWLVENLLLIPRAFFTESVIEKRKPLGPKARRAGWVGCNILLSEIPIDGKIEMVSAGCPLSERLVRDEFSRVRKLADLPPQLRGWTVDVLTAVRRLGTVNSHSSSSTRSIRNSTRYIRRIRTSDQKYGNSSRFFATWG